MRTATARRTRMYIPGRRFLTVLALAALPILVAADLGSVTLVKVAVEDDAGEAARAGMNAFEYDRTVDQQDAELAFRAAEQVAALHDLTIDPTTFVVEPDGSVTLTASRNAPTVMFKKLPWLRDHTGTTATVTAHRAVW